MLKTEIYGYYAFGYNYSIIRRSGLQAFDKAEAIEMLDNFKEFLVDLDLQVTQRIAMDLEKIADELRSEAVKTVTEAFSSRIKAEAARLDPALDAELQLRTAYVMTKKRYSLDSLLESQGSLLGSGVYANLSQTARKDYRLACTQIALNQPTAAAFHLMRALEQQVKMLYFAFKKTKRLDKPMWGPMTKELRSKRAPKPSDKLLDHLDSMRVHFRNPTQHPEAFYTMDEAQDLLNQTLTALNMIAAETP